MGNSSFDVIPRPIDPEEVPHLRDAIECLRRQLQVPTSRIPTLLGVCLPISEWLERAHQQVERTLVIGISGGQGSGKTTLRFFLEGLLEQQGRRVCGFSLDDLYLPRAERQRLAAQVHPLFTTRGVPGTHDVAEGMTLITALRHAKPSSEIALPTFNKGLDERASRDCWPIHRGEVDLVLFDGWCVGVKPQPDEALRHPLNPLEAHDDADGTWRLEVNRRLRTDYAHLFAQIDHSILLAVPNFEKVYEWRLLQEKKLAAASPDAPRVMDAADVERFILHYERLTRHQLETSAEEAAIVGHLGDDHQIRRLSFRDPPPAPHSASDASA